jgi:hypothetical protein
MWNCPKCGRPFTRPHHPHSCSRASVEDFLGGKTPLQVELYRTFEARTLEVGDVNLAPTKSRIGFQHGRIFAAVNGLTRNGLRVHIVTKQPIVSTRLIRLEVMAPDCYINHFLLSSAHDIDKELMEWLRLGYQWA